MKCSNRRSTLILALIAATATGALTGCSDGVALNGKLFDMMGISEGALAAKSAEPKMTSRPGLVLPPDPSRLPEPGSAPDPTDQTLAVVVDPDQKRVADAKERQRLHQAYCSGQMNWKERISDRDASPRSPYGPCGIIGETINSQQN